MKQHTRLPGLRVLLAGHVALAALFGLLIWLGDFTSHPLPNADIDDDIRQLATEEGKVEYLGYWNPGGPIFRNSPAMKRLIARGVEVQPRLISALADHARRNEAALILAEIGDRDAIPHLIDQIPPRSDLPKEEEFSKLCVLAALSRLTGLNTGLDDHLLFNPPDPRTEWQKWYAANKDYLHTPPDGSDARGRRVRVDVEAKLTRTPTDLFRRNRPWVCIEEIRTWRDDPNYEHALREFCFSLLVQQENAHALGTVPGPRALAVLHTLCELEIDSDAAYYLISVLGERGDPASLRVIEKIPRPVTAVTEKSHGEERRAWEVRRFHLRAKYGKELNGKPFDVGQQHTYLRCLEGDDGVAELVAELKNRDHDCFFASYAEVAGYVDRESVRTCLKQITADETRSNRAKTQAHATLARLGEANSLHHLKASLKHNDPGTRLAAAEGLWRLGNRDGVRTLIELLSVRPLESGREGVQFGDGSMKVTAIRDGNVDTVRRACYLLGEIGDELAIEPLRRLLSLNLNGVNGGGGTGWAGRPDAVALAKLGDLSGIPMLRSAIADGDRLDIAGGSWYGGDFVAIGQKRFAAELLPLLDHHKEDKRACAARDILILLDQGR